MRQPIVRPAVVILLALNILCATASVAGENKRDLKEQVEKIGASKKEALSDLNRSLKAGEAVKAIQGFLQTFPAKGKRTPVEALYAGNVLYRLSPDDSMALHQEAFEGLKGEPSPGLEWAIELHRAKRYREALEPYRAFLTVHPDASSMWALYANCLLEAGSEKEAVAAWTKARHASNHTGIDFAIYEVHGVTPPAVRRSKLLPQVRSCDPEAAVSLVRLDLRFDEDWWNADVNQEALEADWRTIDGCFAKANPRLMAELTLLRDVDLGKASEQDLKAAFLGDTPSDCAHLPRPSAVVERVLEEALGRKLVTHDEVLSRCGTELRKRGDSGDVKALNMLAYLVAETRPADLAEIDAFGWKKFGDPRFAASFLAGQEKLRTDSPDLLRALTEFPDSSAIRHIALGLAIDEKKKGAELIPFIVAALKAEYREPSGLHLGHDSYRIKQDFALLGATLGEEAPARPPAP